MSCCFYKGDVFENLKRIPSKSIHLLYINPPFGTTRNKWDSVLDWTKLFKEYFRVLRDDGMLVIHASVPFNYELIRSAPKPPSYSWYWKKDNITCPLMANYQPLRIVEEVLVWKNKKNTYNPQRVGDELMKTAGFQQRSSDYYDYKTTCEKPRGTRVGRVQTHLIDMPRVLDGFSTRPEELIELMIKCYTKEGDTILDTFCYRGLSGRVAKRMNRKWIGIDKYFFADYIL
jgi:site-specific DNA-methyltransferase (adenine-specific)